MKQIYARLNWGRWIADCPVHGEGVAEAVRPGEPMICSRCYPAIYATMPVQIKGIQKDIPDLAMRTHARKQAADADQVYEVLFPEEKDEIEAVTRVRPMQNVNWVPGMTVEDLRRENAEYGVG